ncbi:MAG: hypothetical protein HS104_11625 [Polyangiaceae bacterium]|nr:hypothetical protein [Polyangiaceae bacterium]MCL4748572.1 hypothetical protein [Myxococcales bacterium]
MPITLTFDMKKSVRDTNEHLYLRSAFERFGWRRVGGSAFVYEGKDWLNEAIPALMFFRSFVAARQNELTSFTIQSSSFSTKSEVRAAEDLVLKKPTNAQCHAADLREFVSACSKAIRRPGLKRGPRSG